MSDKGCAHPSARLLTLAALATAVAVCGVPGPAASASTSTAIPAVLHGGTDLPDPGRDPGSTPSSLPMGS